MASRLRTFDPSQAVDRYYQGQDRQRAKSLQDYQVGRQQKADERADITFQQQQEDRPKLQAIADRKQSVADDQNLQQEALRMATMINPDAPDFNEQVMAGMDRYTQKMTELGYDPQVIRAHSEEVFNSGALTPDGIKVLQEKAGMRRKPDEDKGLSAYQLENLRLGYERLKPKPMTPLQEKQMSKMEREEAAAKTKSVDETASAIAAMDSTIGTIDRLLEGDALEKAAGWQSTFPTVGGTDAANFEAMLETLQSQAFLSQVKQMKGMGALSENEGKKLGAAIGSLDLSMSDEALRKELGRIKDIMGVAKRKASLMNVDVPATQQGGAIDFGSLP